jgi:transcriptional regulator GlxA family with amidase domain
MRELSVILFPNFETLDVFGPVEVLGRLRDHFSIRFYSRDGGTVSSTQDVTVVTRPFSEMPGGGFVLLVPGGLGVVELVKDWGYIDALTLMARNAEFVLTVCTGSILLSKTGMLDGKRATSNKRLFAWTGSESPAVKWVKRARWVREGNIYTSSGVSAGIDMTLGFVADLLGHDVAKRQSVEIEYDWKEDPDSDPFAEIY